PAMTRPASFDPGGVAQPQADSTGVGSSPPSAADDPPLAVAEAEPTTGAEIDPVRTLKVLVEVSRVRCWRCRGMVLAGPAWQPERRARGDVVAVHIRCLDDDVRGRGRGGEL